MCARDVSQTSLMRCKETRCPLKQDRAGASFRPSRSGIKGLLVALPVLAMAIAFLTHRQPTIAGFSAGAPESAARTGGKGSNWLGKLFAGHAEAPVDDTPAPAADTPDPQASSRVQMFSCSGALSASRAAICTHWDLATADYNVSLLYNTALAHSARPAGLRRDHAMFVKALDRLNGDPERILAEYRDWQARLATSVSAS